MIDHQDATRSNERIADDQKWLLANAAAYGLAKQVVAYSKDRRKRILAKYIESAQGDSMKEREVSALANGGYWRGRGGAGDNRRGGAKMTCPRARRPALLQGNRAHRGRTPG